MNNNSLYELTVEQEHINLLKKALSSYICLIYDGIDNDVVDVDSSIEDIKVLSDMLAVLKGQNTHKASSDKVGLIWMNEVDLDILQEPTLLVTQAQWDSAGEKGRAFAKELMQSLKDQHQENLHKPETWKERYDRYKRNIQIF